ncbi:Uncharacterized protein Fot_15910 [Forsythia ovata]|uniref:Uncharacterized protein n=1 Tax=Forsythia ovata TaxID=205694 RepID=A0ABD1WAU4_9LAMI
MGASKVEFEHNWTEKGQRAAAADDPNLPLIPHLIPFQNHSCRRSKRRDCKWTKTTLRKTRKRAASNRRKKRGSERAEPKEKGSYRRKKMDSFAAPKHSARRA